MLLRLAGGGLVLGVTDAAREGRFSGRWDARDLDTDVVTDRGLILFAVARVTILLFTWVPLAVANEEALLRLAVAVGAAKGSGPNFFGGKEGTRAISGTGTHARCESLGTHCSEGGTPASVKNWWIFLTTAGG